MKNKLFCNNFCSADLNFLKIGKQFLSIDTDRIDVDEWELL